MKYYKGREFKIWAGKDRANSISISSETESKLAISTRKISHISGSGGRECKKSVTKRTWSVNGSFILSTQTFFELYQLITSNDAIFLMFGNIDFQFSGNAIVTKISVRSSSSGRVSVNVNFLGTGKPNL